MSYWSSPLFENRADAGRRLAPQLARFAGGDVVVAAMLRGGAPVAAEVARAIGAPVLPIFVRKIGVPGQPELAMGAIVAGAASDVVWNDEVVGLVGATPAELDAALAVAIGELADLRQHYPDAREVPIAGRTIILIDDGVATGTSVRAALRALRRGNPKALVLAVPVILGSRKCFDDVADETICLAASDDLFAVGEAYRDFGQVGHEQARAVLQRDFRTS